MIFIPRLSMYVLLIMLIVATAVLVFYIPDSSITVQPRTNTVYGVMVTGKSTERIHFARLSAEQFYQQTYPHKRLIIVNHHPTLRVLSGDTQKSMGDAFEVCVDKEGNNLSLGDLRNIGLNLVPSDASWIAWDDDDWRHPELIQSMQSARTRYKADVVMISNRYEYDINTSFAWQTKLKIGFVHCLCPNSAGIRYLNKDSMEDAHLRKSFLHSNLRVFVMDNDPKMYIRIVHHANTSLLVNKGKTTVRRYSDSWEETAVTKIERQQIEKNISSYIKFLRDGVLTLQRI
jgi:hypothetical protein